MRLFDFTTDDVVAMLTAARGVRCKSSYAQGCRCPVHGGGGSAPAGARTTAVLELACDGSMTCGCNRCAKDRSHLVRIGSRDAPQPWHAGRARHAA